eukprot:scaffold14557_cov42-Prasinocladus_malaysianus.AAC.1
MEFTKRHPDIRNDAYCELATLLQSFARAGEGSPRLWERIQSHLIHAGVPMWPREISTIASAYSTSGRGTPEMYRLLENEAIDKISLFKPLSLSSVCWAFANADYPCNHLFTSIGPQ